MAQQVNTADPVPEDSSYRWLILGTLTVTQIGASIAALSFGPLAPFFQETLAITRAQVGLFTSFLYFGSILVSIPTGRLADLLGVRLLLLIGPAMMAIFFMAFSRTPSYQVALILALFAGMGYGFINPATTKAIIYWFPAKGRATAVGIKQSGVTLGAALAAALLPVMAIAMGWRSALSIVAVVVLILSILCFLFYREFSRAGDPEEGKGRVSRGLIQVITNRNIILLSTVNCAWSSIQLSVSTYLVLYFKEALLIPVVLAGSYLAIAQMSGGVGRVFWGAVSDHLFHSRRKIVLLIIGIITTLTTLSMAAISRNTPTWLLIVIVALQGLSVIGRHGVSITFVAELAGKVLAGTATGVSITIAYTGIIVGAPIFGHIVDITHSYSLAWLIFGVVSAVSTAVLLLVREKDDRV